MQKEGKDTARRIMNCVMKERTEELASNLAVLIDHQVREGRTEQQIEKAINDCIEYVHTRALNMNLMNTLIMGMMYSICHFQISMIKEAAKMRGVTEELFINEVLVDMESETQKGSHG